MSGLGLLAVAVLLLLGWSWLQDIERELESLDRRMTALEQSGGWAPEQREESDANETTQ